MHLYEIKAASFAKRLLERSTDIEQDLEKTASEIGRASGIGQDDETLGMGAQEFGQAPDPMAGQSPLQAQGDLATDDLAADEPMDAGATDEEMDELLMKKVDSILINTAKGHNYAKRYRHPENSKIHPYRILAMTMDELTGLRTMARSRANLETFNGDLGAYDNPNIAFFQDLVSFVDKVIDVNKKSTKEYKDGKEGKTANFDTRADAKTKAGKVKKPKVK